MSNYEPKPPVTRETMPVCHGVAWIIPSSRSEQEAVKRICRFLSHWEYPVGPSELGSCVRDP